MKVRYAVLVLLAVSVITACKKNQLGGKSMVQGKVMHHSKLIANARVFIKFNAKEFPGSDTSKYDAKLSADASGSYSFSCYPGNYFVYGFGIDLGVPAPHHVVAGIPVKVRQNETVKADIPVTEGD